MNIMWKVLLWKGGWSLVEKRYPLGSGEPKSGELVLEAGPFCVLVIPCCALSCLGLDFVGPRLLKCEMRCPAVGP